MIIDLQIYYQVNMMINPRIYYHLFVNVVDPRIYYLVGGRSDGQVGSKGWAGRWTGRRCIAISSGP